jgi:hypothetical protein
MSIKHIRIELLVHEDDVQRIMDILNTEFLHYGLRVEVEGD